MCEQNHESTTEAAPLPPYLKYVLQGITDEAARAEAERQIRVFASEAVAEKYTLWQVNLKTAMESATAGLEAAQQERNDARAVVARTSAAIRNMLQDYLISEQECNSEDFEAVYGRRGLDELMAEMEKRLSAADAEAAQVHDTPEQARKPYDGGLPKLPTATARLYTQGRYRRASVLPGPGEPLFASNQMQAYAREAIADARREWAAAITKPEPVEWRVAECESSSTPGTFVLVLARNAQDVHSVAAHKSFVRWVYPELNIDQVLKACEDLDIRGPLRDSDRQYCMAYAATLGISRQDAEALIGSVAPKAYVNGFADRGSREEALAAKAA